MDKNILESAGLTNLEIKVYIAILDTGSASAGSISTKSGVHRRSVYDAVDRLLEKGLVSTMMINNRREFQAVNPERLLALIEERKTDIELILPELKLKYNMASEKNATLFYKGKEGIKSIFDDQLSTRQTIQIISGSKTAYDLLPYYFIRFDDERVKKKIKVKILFNSDARKIKKPRNSEVKYLPKEYTGVAAINIYGNNTSIIHWSKENPFGILIRQPEIAMSYMNYFDMLWNIAKK